jgi:DNA polymerase I-like protein with 3'-5' exonuclease and polymerase domains
VVALGETALGVFGKEGIHNWRGSCFEWEGINVVPTLHPAFIMREQKLWRFCVGDIRFAAHEGKRYKQPQLNYTINPSPQWFDEWTRNVQGEVSLDLETSTDFSVITQVALSAEPHTAVCIDLEEHYLVPLLRLLKRPDILWVGQNIVMFDSLRLAELGAPLITVHADVMLAHHLLESPAPHDLGFINSHWVRYPYYKDEIDTNRHVYACKDADVTLQAWRRAKQELIKEGMWELFRTVMTAAHYVRKMSLRGVPVDAQLVAEAAQQLRTQLEEPLARLREISGNKFFNPRSFKDCADLLYDKLQLPKQYRRKGKVRVLTCDDDALVALAKLHEAPRLILAYRRPANDLSKYFRPDLVHNGRLYLDWRIHGTETGRYSCWFHTLPPRVRHVVRQPGKLIAYADAQQGEFRIAAWCADDRKAKEVADSPLGIHVANACLIFRCEPEEVTPMRKFYAKFTTYGWLYGRGADSIEEQYGVPHSYAEEILKQLNDTYKRIVMWKIETARFALTHGWLRNPFGRRRYFSEGSADDKEREAYAFIPQSTLHDITMRAHILTETTYSEDECAVVADMHDALLMVVDPSFDVQHYKALVSREYLPGLVMPFDCDVHEWWYDKRAEEDAKVKGGQL